MQSMDVDYLLFAAIDVDVGLLPPEGTFPMTHADHTVLDTALNAVQTARNGEVSALHQEVAQRLRLRMPRDNGDGPGYVLTEQNRIDRAAIVEHIESVGPTVAGIVATAYALDPTQSEPKPSRVNIRHPRLPRGYQALQRTARRLVLGDNYTGEQAHQVELTLPPRLYGIAASRSRAYPTPHMADVWAVGLFGAYTAAWVDAHRSQNFLKVINRLDRARHQALVDVYTRFEQQRRRYPRADRSGVHERIGQLGIQALGLRMGALLGRKYVPGVEQQAS